MKLMKEVTRVSMDSSWSIVFYCFKQWALRRRIEFDLPREVGAKYIEEMTTDKSPQEAAP